ncbi:MAG: dTDP-4-dehydrorhamnose 3,5-epimerase [Spirochaetae bacterium HGW-Spirochaetae-1]|jgi:dTDP-4-dehydrorhamnose 3,5-epimerase|nr:MAG: dTDP-4-dehydrorhamnose 3,5-epimerase [Spirochaetae bacterium HGW-Spirochaetae-1]
MPFSFKELSIPGVCLIEPRIFPDDRGFFFETFKASDFIKNNIDGLPVQINHSRSSKNVLRGLHYQLSPMAQAKLVRVLSGEIFDVAVDIRKDSPSYGKWAGELINSDIKNMLYIPAGFAHGFCVISETAEIEYLVFGGEYSPQHDRGILWNDPAIGIQWPVENPILSAKDASLPLLKDAENNFMYEENK